MKFFAHAFLLLLACFMAGTAGAAEIGPDELVKNTTNEVLDIVRQDKDIQGGNTKKTLALVDAKVLPHFDFARMTRLAVGRFWNQATPEQQQRLTAEFRALLVRTYSTSLSTYKNQTIDFRPFRMNAGDTDVQVKTVVVQSGRQPIPIDYTMVKTSGGWKVYDITVEGVSLVVNYRSSFAQEVQQGGIERLIQTLVDKNAAANAARKS